MDQHEYEVRLAEEAYRVVKEMAALDRAGKLTHEDQDRLAARLTFPDG
jgi:hypothetical protein